ncbi:hypothetical protein N7457_001978 [Penicillium paradoxum]|uniref:uncharacterized protein n=1 Tax=Penicillium paradoxum TaxID=176176 RepID=UPI00254703DB|nr:uncharacterized protein N7457_001978 [Penicillium paradoxum]KAJ5786988.1 hypothetical protein N7457_001978 [Penicillium paradoxum]
MDMATDSQGIKRIRQACANCRRKKTKCTGDRPICSHCRRNRLACIYEPYSVTVAETTTANPTVSGSPMANSLNVCYNLIAQVILDFVEILTRVDIDGIIAKDQHDRDPPSRAQWACAMSKQKRIIPPSCTNPHVTGNYFRPIIAIANYISRKFQAWLKTDLSLPLQFSTPSSTRTSNASTINRTLRFSDHEFYAGQTHEASQKYARESWLSVLADHLTVEDNLNVHVVQTVNLLAIVDYTAGRVRSGWLKIGLAARISQDLHLMSEPDQWLPYSEQEEHRRAFWSVYLVDKLISCGRSRPLVILDEDCEVQVPCEEHFFRNGEWRKTNTIGQLLNWNSKVADSPSPFALVVLMASIFGRCTRYVHQNKKMDEVPPWDQKSEFSAINSSLLLLESYSKSGNWRLRDVLRGGIQVDGTVDRQEIGHLVFAHTLFHICHCLLNHPFLVRRWLKPFGAKAPASFSSRALHEGCDHAKQLMDLLREATEYGYPIESSFYAYCIAVAGGIHSLSSHFERSRAQDSDSLHYFQQSIDALEKLAKRWVHAGNIAAQLRDFHSMSHDLASLLDPSHLMDELDSNSEEIMWSMIDYAIMGADSDKRPKPTASLPSPGWAVGAGMMGPGFDTPSANLLGLTPSRLEEFGPLGPTAPFVHFAWAKALGLKSFIALKNAGELITDIHIMAQDQASPWEGVASGTTAAILANTIVYPLDVVKTRLQVQVQPPKQKEAGDPEKLSDSPEAQPYYDNAIDAIRHILREEGILGLYSGLGSSILSTASMNFAYFYWSTAARSIQQSAFRRYGVADTNSISKELGLGAIGGAMAQLCTNPIAVISTRQQTCTSSDEKKSMWDTMKEIIQSEDGWTGLWRGFKVNLILVINPMITYGVYQWLRGVLLALKRGKALGSGDAFLLGALSKVLATITTHPLIVAKIMLQSKPPDCRKGRPFSGFTEVLQYIVRNEGFFRLYKGLAPQIIKGFIVQGLMMTLKERTEGLLRKAILLNGKRLHQSTLK